jgi:hypothetical protein
MGEGGRWLIPHARLYALVDAGVGRSVKPLSDVLVINDNHL